MVSSSSVELLLHHLVSRHMAVRVGQTISVCPAEDTTDQVWCWTHVSPGQHLLLLLRPPHHDQLSLLPGCVWNSRGTLGGEDSICKIVAVSITVTSPSPHDQLKISILRMIPLYFSRRRVTDWIVFVCSWVTLTSAVTSCPGGDWWPEVWVGELSRHSLLLWAHHTCHSILTMHAGKLRGQVVLTIQTGIQTLLLSGDNIAQYFCLDSFWINLDWLWLWL